MQPKLFNLCAWLCHHDLIRPSQGQVAQGKAVHNPYHVIHALCEVTKVNPDSWAQHLATHLKLTLFNGDWQNLSVIPAIPKAIYTHFHCLAIQEQHVVCLLVSDPFHTIVPALISALLGQPVYLKICSHHRLLDTLERLNDPLSPALSAGLKEQSTLSPNNPTEHLIEQILQKALKHQASDIHFEPQEQHYRIRIRVDGLLRPFHFNDKVKLPEIVSRLKILAELDIATKRHPQDGRMKILLKDRCPLDIRMSTCPTLTGEKVVLRLLDTQQKALSISDLGLLSQQEKILRDAIKQPSGLILITGPTGSGKTITLYSLLESLNNQQLNICTVEDPVEVHIAGINQVAVHQPSGATFPILLRSFLRQDPDVMMVGEIRDSETAQIAIKAAQTGHLVLATVHSQNTQKTIKRLVRLGVQPEDLHETLLVIVAQRLLRRLCPKCKTIDEHKQYFKAQGCPECHQGYRGRLAVFELLSFKDHMPLPLKLTLKQAAQIALKLGHTTCQDIQRIVG